MLNYQRVVLKSSLGMIEQWVENLGQKHDWAGTEHIHPETAKQIAWLQIPPKRKNVLTAEVMKWNCSWSKAPIFKNHP